MARDYYLVTQQKKNPKKPTEGKENRLNCLNRRATGDVENHPTAECSSPEADRLLLRARETSRALWYHPIPQRQNASAGSGGISARPKRSPREGSQFWGLVDPLKKFMRPTLSSFLSFIFSDVLIWHLPPFLLNLLSGPSGRPVPHTSSTRLPQTHRHELLPRLLLQRSLPTRRRRSPLSPAQSAEIHMGTKERNRPT